MHLYYSTFPDKKTAIEIGKKLVADKNIACMNILSEGCAIFEWQGKADVGDEVFCILKSAKNFDQLWPSLKALHPYDTPCLIELGWQNINPDYKDWVESA